MGLTTGPDSFCGVPSSCCLLEGLGWAGLEGAGARAEDNEEEHRWETRVPKTLRNDQKCEGATRKENRSRGL